MTIKRRILILAAGLTILAACRKNFLDVKPDKALLVPTTLSDFWALLDNNQVFNISPGLTAIADGDFYTTDAGWKAYLTDAERNSYTWSARIFGSEIPSDWNVPYQQVFYANVVLDGLQKLTTGADSAGAVNAVKGTALFNRAFAFYNLAQEFTPQFASASATADLGLPLRLNPDVTLKVPRSNNLETYNQILLDLRSAAHLLPRQVMVKSRPSKGAAYALLSKVYLVMGDFAHAGMYADSSLAQNSALIDYNSLSSTATRPFPRALPYGNAEVIYYSALVSYSFSGSASPTFVDSLLYRSYQPNDLRKVILCRAAADGTVRFKGSYAGTISTFSGLATDEVYLIRAECRARAGDLSAAMQDLNTLLARRWATDRFVPFAAATTDEALAIIFSERRKELVGRNLHWSDLRRWNTDARFQMTLRRNINGQADQLIPQSRAYVYPIPEEEIRLSNLVQNPR